MPTLTVLGAREHNLRDVDLELTLGQWIAVTGPSGSGKSSLVFDAIVREGQRRFLGSLSARARHYFGKLGRGGVRALTGLPPTVAVGQDTLTANARSTVGTLTGGLDLLRLLYARQARDPGGQELTRSHFSFNHPLGACEACQGLGVEDRVDPQLLVADPSKSIRDGALVPTLANGYTVYSQVTLEVMNQICQAHGFDVHTPWADLDATQRDVIMNGTTALEVPFGKHSIESRMKWEGITARPREQGHYRGLVPVITETLLRNRNPNILRFVQSVPCTQCGGSRLARAGREATLGPHTLPAVLARPVATIEAVLDQFPACAVWEALRPSLLPRLQRMQRLGLGHLSLDRESTTLSGGEAQRLRLAAQLSAGLSRMLFALDEPTLGLHPGRQPGMAAVLDELVTRGNTLMVVEHDPDMVRYADRLVQLGPGAGPEGGRLVFDGPLPADPLGPPPVPRQGPPRGADPIVLRGATLHNLQRAELVVHRGAFTVVLGPSGAGKSSLVFGTLLPALEGRRGGPHASIDGIPGDAVGALDARPIGRTPRSTPATWSGLFDLVRKRFAATDQARERGWKAGRFSYNNREGRCPDCEGLGVQRIGLHLMADAETRCGVCAGGRYAPQTLEVTLRGRTIADVLAMTLREARTWFADDPPIASLCTAMDELGLGHLKLGQSSNTLSRGESQRVKLATLLGKPTSDPRVLLLDEPDRGLHPEDVGRLLRSIDALVEAGHTVLAISHHRHLWAAADHLVEVRDGVARPNPTLDWERLSTVGAPRAPAQAAAEIHLHGVRTHTLANLDVRIPHDRLTVLAGVSGSGKTSLAFDTLASEAWHRFSESLPFQVRRFVRRMPRPDLDHADGLGPTLTLRQGHARAGRRSTVATQSELGPLLRLLWSRAGRVDGQRCTMTAEHFSPDRPLGACPSCEGMGTVARCDPERLVTDPTRALTDGALDGTRPGRFFGEPDGQYIATIRAVLPKADLDRPWRTLPESTRRVVLHGAGERTVSVKWKFQRGARSGEHTFEGTWDGLCALVERESRRRAKSKQAAAWAEPLRDAPCDACEGRRLRPAVAEMRVGSHSLPDLMALPLHQVEAALVGIPADASQRAVLDAVLPELTARLRELTGLGLGHLTLHRRTQTLSDGELQRTRLASVLRSGLTGMTLVLDEPSAGLHARDVSVLLEHLTRLRDEGNTIIVVAHRPAMIRAACHLLELGPGAGLQGGRIVAEGPPAQVLSGSGPTANALRHPAEPRPPRAVAARVNVRGAHLHNLRNIDVDLPAAGFVAITGVSGSGKSTLVFDVIEASAQAGRPRGCTAVDGLDRFVETRTSRALGRGTCPLTAMQLMAPLQRLFHGVAADSGLSRQAFSFASPAGRCDRCQGSGRETVAMDILADLALPCPACRGRRYRPEVLEVQWNGLDIATVLERPVGDLRALMPEGKLRAGLDALIEVGLGHVSLGRRREELSGGEAQRLTLAAALVHGRTPALYLLDEPATGLHEADLARLVAVFQRLADRGDLVIAAEHRLSLIRAADWVVDLGPGSGPEGGTVVEAGPPAALRLGATAHALAQTR
ncbi:MAG: hypothetical protein K0V04_37000 [Deltaproteobacteria bacterium]|nr:hypothetical protein [Deltaproteobacteria bacterium]